MKQILSRWEMTSLNAAVFFLKKKNIKINHLKKLFEI